MDEFDKVSIQKVDPNERQRVLDAFREIRKRKSMDLKEQQILWAEELIRRAVKLPNQYVNDCSDWRHKAIKLVYTDSAYGVLEISILPFRIYLSIARNPDDHDDRYEYGVSIDETLEAIEAFCRKEL